MYWCRTLAELALYSDNSSTTPLVRAGKSLAVLSYVGLSPQRAECRDRIVTLFWPGTPLPQAHHALRQALYRLRQSAGDEALIELRDNVVHCSHSVRFDCIEAEEALAAGDPNLAWDLLRGEFLEGFSIPDSVEFEEWVEAQRARFRECFRQTAESLIESNLAAGSPQNAIGVAEQLQTVNPLEERSIALLMRALDRAGQTHRALAEFRVHESLLASALEDEPSDELQEYAEELERSLESLLPNGSTTLPFVGRSSAWSILLDALTRAEADECSVVLIEGDAGLGKTRLIEEFAARARARGAAWLSGKCYEMEQTLPFAVISHVIRTVANNAGHPVPDLAHPGGAVKHRSGPHSGAEGDGGLRLRTEVVSWLESRATDESVLLTCDDIHWADPASLRLLHFAREELAASRILILCSYRPAELSPVARRFAGSLASEGLAQIVTLTPLTLEDVAEILLTLGEFDNPEFARALAADLHRHTGGNPLFIAELLGALEIEGLLRIKSGYWTADVRLKADELPKTLRKILTDKVDALAPDLRFALDVMSVLGEATGSQLAAHVLGISAPKAEVVLTGLASHRLLRRVRFDAYEMAHDELRQLVYAAVPDDRRREIHAKVAKVLEQHGEAARPGGAARLTRHLAQAGDAARARTHALAAAREAAAIGAAEARNSFLQLADAFVPGEHDDRWNAENDLPLKRTKRRLVRYVAAGVALAAVTLLILVGNFTKGASRDLRSALPWEQGNLYLRQLRGTEDGTSAETLYRVQWPIQPGDSVRLAEVAGWPADMPPRLAARVIDVGDHRPTKIYRVTGDTSVQLTTGLTDDGSARWSPDRRWIAFKRGWRDNADYRFNIFIMDSAGKSLRQLTHGNYQDTPMDWSPDGSRLAFYRNDGGYIGLWITDADGERSTNLSDALNLPMDQGWNGVFSPDGRKLAGARSGIPSIEVIDLQQMLRQSIGLSCSSLSSPPILWSPDGEWFATICVTQTGRYLSVVSADGISGPHVLLEAPPSRLLLHEWVGSQSTAIESIEILPQSEIRPLPLEIRTGEGLRLTASTATASGSVAFPSIRWATTDSTVATIDSLGFLRGRKAGSSLIVASAGGFKADTAAVRVTGVAIDTLLYETWASGIDTTRWRFVGIPLPEIITGAGLSGGSALISNGDDRWPSGVLSRQEFELRHGLTIEFWLRLHYTGLHWQEVEVMLAPQSHALIANERSPTFSVLRFTIMGPSPTYKDPVISCRSGDHGPLIVWSVEAAHRGWHHIVLQVRPDKQAECLLDGESLGAFPMPDLDTAPGVALFLGGRSNQTQIYYGPVVVTQGLRY